MLLSQGQLGAITYSFAEKKQSNYILFIFLEEHA